MLLYGAKHIKNYKSFSMKQTYDLAVIGAGPGGYIAALKATALKARVALIERDSFGGACLNLGCRDNVHFPTRCRHDLTDRPSCLEGLVIRIVW